MNGNRTPLVLFPKVILFGDSLTQKCMSIESPWGAQVADFLARKCDVIVRGFSGYNTRKALALLPHLFDGINFSSNVAALVLFFGANDASAGEHNESGVPRKEFVENLIFMGDYFIKRGLSPSKIIMVGPPAFNAPAWEKKALLMGMNHHIRTNELAGIYSDLVTEVCKHLSCRNVPLHSKMNKEPDWRDMLIDGLHFNEKGANFFYTLLKPHLSHLTYDIPLLLPTWKDFDSGYNPNADTYNPSQVVHDWINQNKYFAS